MPIDYVQVGKVLRAAREAKGLRQIDVAKKLGMTGAGVSAIELGKTKTSLENLEIFANMVGCRLTLILTAADDPRAIVGARLLELLPDLEEPLFATLAAWVDLWDVRSRARQGGTA